MNRLTRDIILSVVLHGLVLAATLVSAPFSNKPKIDPGDVIRVTITAAPPMQAGAPQAPVPEQPTLAVKTEPKAVPLPDKKQPKPPVKKKQEPKKKPPKEMTAAELAKLMEESGSKTGTGDKQSKVQGAGVDENSPFAGASIDNANFQYPYWFTQAFTKIQSNWRNPVEADYSLICVVYFQVLRSGRVVEPQVVESSDDPMFDQACLRAIERSDPFPPLPHDFRDDIIGITLPFKYQP